MIVTVTPNPSLDLTYRLPPGSVQPVEVLRAQSVTLEASGKGVNVTRTLLLSGTPSRCVLPLGGPVGGLVAGLLADQAVPARVVGQRGETRVNTSILAPDRPALKVNAAGSALSASELDDLLAAVEADLAEPCGPAGSAGSAGPEAERWLAVCGSLPPDTGPELVGRLVELGRRVGWRTAVDTHGPALAAAVDARADLVAPNTAELAALFAELAGAVDHDADPGGGLLVEATARFSRRSGCAVLLSRGADGALWTDGGAVLLAAADPVLPVNPAGAGDALLAGWLAAAVAGADQESRLRRAVAWGTGCCLVPTTVADLREADGGAVQVWSPPRAEPGAVTR